MVLAPGDATVTGTAQLRLADGSTKNRVALGQMAH
jgi:hypothetical protein